MPDLTANQELMKILAAAALSPGLHSILVFDAPSSGLRELAVILQQLLEVTTDRRVESYQLGPFETDDDVWGSVVFPNKPPLLRLFSPERNVQAFQLLTLPDLAELSQVAARTCTMLVGAEIAHLERHEQHESWRPQQCWLAACGRADVGKISPHLLDRFALRLQWQDIDPSERFDDEKRAANVLARVPRDLPATDEALPVAILRQLETARHQQVAVPPDILAAIIEYFPHEQYYPRREIALARLALALAQLAGASTLSIDHIEDAVRLLGMQMQPSEDGDVAEEEEEAVDPVSQEDLPQQLPTLPEPVLPQEPQVPRMQEVNIPEAISSTTLESGTLCSEEPYPEDTAFSEREAASLQLSVTRSPLSRSAQGPVIGVEESETLSDLAIVATILAALKFQKIRRSPTQERSKSILFRDTDLRRYRRGAALEHVLMVLLDYTSTRDNVHWREALLPYLGQAYTDRAGVVVIKVGAEDALSELQAEIVSARNIMVPSIGEAFELGSGRATPLFHGLNLAREKLRHLLQHGRAITREVTFLIISDGRGNVSAKTSLSNTFPRSIVGQEGIEDALNEAVRLSALQRVEIIVFDPQPLYYPELLESLAQALGAQRQIIPRESLAGGTEDDG